MLKAKTKLYPWQCFSCEVVYESNVEASVIFVTPKGLLLHGCYNCRELTHIEDIVCVSCYETFLAVYHESHDTVVCKCGHINALH
jgi:hypothetical protein